MELPSEPKRDQAQKDEFSARLHNKPNLRENGSATAVRMAEFAAAIESLQNAQRMVQDAMEAKVALMTATLATAQDELAQTKLGLAKASAELADTRMVVASTKVSEHRNVLLPLLSKTCFLQFCP
eukprot:TRINITY_DN33384_c0_g1_i1.p1 TRINITY_DN33384_c0_g1~~TRINITY_DN33384_c0_g1_i1.p1  ORF type:complete len:125 (-),score=5.07 TRINITY_DN33384_c0_g1_i1:71-445(-)